MYAGAAESINEVLFDVGPAFERSSIGRAIFRQYLKLQFRPYANVVELKSARTHTAASTRALRLRALAFRIDRGS